MNAGTGLCALVLLAGTCAVSHAQIEREVRFESEPGGARVYLLSGDRRELLGRTPLVHRVEFHSEQSILRVEFRHAGTIAKLAEIGVGQPEVVTRLTPRPLSARIDTLDDATQRSVAPWLGQIQSALEAASPLLTETGLDFDRQPAQIVRTPDGLLLEVAIIAGAQQRLEDPPSHWWTTVAQPMFGIVAAKLRDLQGLTAIGLSVRLPSTRGSFAVEATVADDRETVCVGGVRQTYDSCATQDTRTGSYGRCQPGYRNVFDPCLTRTVVTTRRATLSPQSGSRTTHEELVYRLALDSLPPSGAPPYERVAVRHSDAGGKVIYERQAAPR